MIWQKNKRLVLCTLIPLLAFAGCTTTSTQTADNAQEPAQIARAEAADSSVVMSNANPNSVLLAINTAESNTADANTTSPITDKNFPDIWSRLRTGFAIKPLDSTQVDREIKWFAANPEYMQRMMERARLYLYYIADEVEKRGMPMEIALLPAIESAYKPNAYSRARAVGLWQFMPATGRLYGLKANWWYEGRRDVQASTKAALDYLEKLYNDFDGDWHLALAAYNAGEGKVGRMMEYNRRKGKSTDYQYLKLKRETQHYVPKLLAMASIVADPAKYGVQLAAIPNEPYFTRIDAGSQIDLGVVAKLANVPIDDLYNINPGYTRWATDPSGRHHLLVPIDKKDALLEGLSNLSVNERILWQHHAVKHGDTMSFVAKRYGVSVEAIRTSNSLRSNLLRAGQDLLIPMSSQAMAMKAPVIRAAYQSSSQRSSAGAVIVHRVRRGDTLSGIARRYKVLVNQLVKWNLLDPSDILRRGQKVKIWTSGGPTASLEISSPNS